MLPRIRDLRTFTLLLCLGFLGIASDLRAVALGATKADVVAELGPPLAQAHGGNKEILTYPKHVQITLEDGHVISATGIALTVDEPEALPPPTPSPALARGRARPTTTPSSDEAPATPTVVPTRAPTPTPTHAPAAAPARRLPAPLALPSAPLARRIGRASDALPVSAKLLTLGVHLLLTLVGLKIAFKVWSMATLPSGLFMIALIDLMLQGVLLLLGPTTNGLTTMPAVQNGIPGLVMIFSIHHFSFNKNYPDAVRTAALVKIAVALLQMALTMALISIALR